MTDTSTTPAASSGWGELIARAFNAAWPWLVSRPVIAVVAMIGAGIAQYIVQGWYTEAAVATAKGAAALEQAGDKASRAEVKVEDAAQAAAAKCVDAIAALKPKGKPK